PITRREHHACSRGAMPRFSLAAPWAGRGGRRSCSASCRTPFATAPTTLWRGVVIACSDGTTDAWFRLPNSALASSTGNEGDMRLSKVHGTIKRRLLINYRVDPAVIIYRRRFGRSCTTTTRSPAYV